MRLHEFYVSSFKNLTDVTINFDQEHWVTVVIGWNGTGKSNVLEALATLFRDLIMGTAKPTFAYQLIYECRGQLIKLEANPEGKKAYEILSGTAPRESIENYDNWFAQHGNSVAISKFRATNSQWLPEYVFGYYSGFSDRMENVFHNYIERYDKKLRNGEDPGLKRLFYAKPVHSQFVLLAFLLHQDTHVREFLEKQLGIDPDEGIDSVLFVLSQPPWNSKADDGDHRFWNARGVVSKFLGQLYDVSIAPLRISRRVASSMWNKKSREFLYLYVKDTATLRKLVADKAPREFFRDLESTYVSELIEEVRIRIKLRKNDGSVTFRELSEGEQQLLTVLGLLRFTAEDESLLLLDEPGTHLNPRWSTDYLDYLTKFVGTDNVNSERSHVVLTTHDPLSIAELRKEQIQILQRDPETLTVSAQPPEFDPRGMGYSGIVTSDMFGLASSLDKYTQNLLEEKRQLAAIDKISDQQSARLSAINEELKSYDFRFDMRDPVYSEYLRARAEFDDAPASVSQENSSSAQNREKAKRLISIALESAGKE